MKARATIDPTEPGLAPLLPELLAVGQKSPMRFWRVGRAKIAWSADIDDEGDGEAFGPSSRRS